MLYVPGKFLFIHIPRTAGNAITRFLCKELVLRRDLVCWTDPRPAYIHRHSRAIELQAVIPDFTSIVKFAVDRPYTEILKSYHALEQNTGYGIEGETLEEFEQRKFTPWLAGKTPWQHWCCDEDNNELGVHRLQFENIDWGWMLKTACIGTDVSIPVLDWQTHHLKGLL